MTTYYTQQPQIVAVTRLPRVMNMYADHPQTNVTATVTISGTAYDGGTGLPVGAGVPVFLVRKKDGYSPVNTLTDSSGHWLFVRDASDLDQYRVEGDTTNGMGVQIHGTTDWDLVAS